MNSNNTLSNNFTNNLTNQLFIFVIFFIFLIFIINIFMYQDDRKPIKEKKPIEVPQKATWFQRY